MSFNNSGVLNDFRAITKHDTNENHCVGLYVGVSGDVAVVTANGTTTTLVGLAAGVWHPISVSKVLSTGTTATDILGGRP